MAPGQPIAGRGLFAFVHILYPQSAQRGNTVLELRRSAIVQQEIDDRPLSESKVNENLIEGSSTVHDSLKRDA